MAVQVGSFSSQENAEKLVARLREAKLPTPDAELVDIKGKRYYRVKVGPVVERAEAEEWLPGSARSRGPEPRCNSTRDVRSVSGRHPASDRIAQLAWSGLIRGLAGFLILGIILLSSLISLARGFVREAFSLAIWVLAFWVSWSFFRHLEVPMRAWIDSPTARLG